MENTLTITIIQHSLYWEDIDANLTKFSKEIAKIVEKVDIIILPEMFSTGFSMKPELFAEPMNGKAINFMKMWALKKGIAICGSVMIKENEQYFNRLVWVEPNGKIVTYDKAHLFRMGEEQSHFSKGADKVIINYKNWNIAPFICYDLRFPVFLRRTPAFEYELMLIPANWPERRNMHWKVLTQARAIENQVFVIGVNRVGLDGNQINHSGDSLAIKPNGEIIFIESGIEIVKTFTIHKEELLTYRANFPVEKDADTFELSGNATNMNKNQS